MAGSLKKIIMNTLGPRNYGRLRNTFYLTQVSKEMLAGTVHTCNICGYNGRFRAFGQPPRYGAQCPACLGLERHRLLKAWADDNPSALAGRTVLHFAPEVAVARFLKPMAGKYIAADLNPNHADLVLNIEQIALPN